MAAKRADRPLVVEPRYRPPRFGTSAGVHASSSRYLGVDYFAPNQLVVYDPLWESRQLSTIKSDHRHPITAITASGRDTFAYRDKTLDRNELDYFATGDVRGKVVLTGSSGTCHSTWDPNLDERFNDAAGRAVLQIAAGPRPGQLTVLHDWLGGERSYLVVLTMDQPSLIKVHRRDGAAIKYAAISSDGRQAVVRQQHWFNGGWVYDRCWLEVECDGFLQPYQIPGRVAWLADRESRSFCFTPDGTGLITAGGQDGNGLTRWDTITGEIVWESRGPHSLYSSLTSWPIQQVRCSPDSQWVGMLDHKHNDTGNSHFTLMDLETGAVQVRIASKLRLGGFDFSDGSTDLAFVHPERQVVVCWINDLLELAQKAGEHAYLGIPGEHY